MRTVYLILLSYFTSLLQTTKSKSYIHINLIVVLCHNDHYDPTGVSITISPSPIAEVCYVGDRLLVTCNVSDSFLRWRFTYVFENGTTDQTFTEDVTASASSSTARPMNNPKSDIDMFFTRISERNALPFVSTVQFSAVPETLNRTIITCIDFDGASLANTTVLIAMESSSEPLHCNVIYHYICTSGDDSMFNAYAQVDHLL